MLPPLSKEDATMSPPAQMSRVFQLITRNIIVILSIVVAAIALHFVYTPAATVEQLPANISTVFERFMFFAWAGLYCWVAWLAVTTGQLWILDFLGGQFGQMCGNKFLYCRPWD
jgi:hypothetical protein